MVDVDVLREIIRPNDFFNQNRPTRHLLHDSCSSLLRKISSAYLERRLVQVQLSSFPFVNIPLSFQQTVKTDCVLSS